MQKQLNTLKETIQLLHNQRTKVDQDITNANKRQELLISILESPIFTLLKSFIFEDIACIVYDFLDIQYCTKHNTHFSKNYEFMY